MTYYILQATLNDCIREFFTINLLSLINGEAVLLYHNSPYCLIELSGKKDPVFGR